MKKLLTLALLACITAQLCACGSGADTKDTTGTAAVTAETATTTPETDPLDDELPSADYGGREFRIYNYEQHRVYFYADELDGDVVNDAIYNARTTVEDRFNTRVTSTVYSNAAADSKTKIGNIISSGDDSFEIATMHDITCANMSLEGVFMNLYDIPHLNFEKAWWPSATVEDFTLNGKMYLIINSISYSNTSSTLATYANKGRLKDYSLTVPYQAVYDGTWTFDMLISMSKDVYEDTNGDAQRDDGDFYGFIDFKNFYERQSSFGIKAYNKTAGGGLTLLTDFERVYTMLDKYYNILFECEGGRMFDGMTKATTKFNDGGGLFYFGFLYDASRTFRYSDVDYAFLPMPKLDEAQEDYICCSYDNPAIIPITAADTDFTGMIIEALSAEGYKQIQPAYFETALQQKFTTDEESVDMLNIIADKRIVSFTEFYGLGGDGLSYILYNMFGKPATPSKDFASFYATVEAKELAQLEKVTAAFAD